MIYKFVLHLLFTFSLLCLFSVSFSQDCSCIDGINVDSDNVYRYRMRGNRCEGEYVKRLKSNSRSLPVVGYFAREHSIAGSSYPNYYYARLLTNEQRNITLLTTSKALHVQYLMNTCLNGAQTFRWPSYIARELGVALDNLVAKASVKRSTDSTGIETLVPVVLTDSDKRDHSDDYRLVLAVKPWRLYTRVRITITNQSGAEVYTDTLAKRYFPALRVFTFRIPTFASASPVSVVIKATNGDVLVRNKVRIIIP